MSDTPDSLLDVPLMRRLAGDSLFARGEAYFADGRVRQLQAGADRATGRVEGSRAYRVKLWKSRGEFRFSCTCAAGQDQLFCKHCVAVGLAWLAIPATDGATVLPTAEPAPPKGPRSPADEAARQTLADHLRRLTPERLAGLVLEATDYDDILRRRLLLEAVGVARTEGTRRGAPADGPPDFEGYRQLLREAIETADYVDYDAIPDYAQGVQDAIAPLRGLLRDGHAAAVIDLAEDALIALDKSSAMLDGSDGSLNPVYDDLQRFHLEACRAARPEPNALAARLLHYEIEGGLGVFYNAAKVYADVLGTGGSAEWRRLLIEEWSHLTATRPVDRRERIDHRRFQLHALMETLAESEDDTALLIAVKESDLSSAHDFLSLAELHAARGRDQDAIARAEEGLHLHGADEDAAGLRDFLISAYTRTGHPELALELAWQQFARSGDGTGYRRLRDHLHLASTGEWPVWRERALARLRERLTREAVIARGQNRSHPPDGSLLVEILLEEHDDEAAWQEARTQGCRVDLWLRLAAGRENENPADALGVYQARLEPALAAGGQSAYREAVGLLVKIRALL